jgi:hypothetical protein
MQIKEFPLAIPSLNFMALGRMSRRHPDPSPWLQRRKHLAAIPRTLM